MILNEDYFNDLNLNDEDVPVDDGQSLSDIELSDTESLNRHLTSKYKNSITIQFDASFDSKKRMQQMLWDNDIPRTLKRIQYVLNAYNIEYEYVFRDNSYMPLNVYKAGEFSVLSAFNEKMFYSCNADKRIYLIIYLNFPDFTYRESYNFVDMLQSVIWRNKRHTQADWFEIIRPAVQLFNFLDNNNADATIFISEYDVNAYLDNTGTMKYKKYFTKALLFFHDSLENKKDISKMINKIFSEIDPFNNKD